MKKALVCLMAFAVLCGALPMTGAGLFPLSATAATVDSGSCGETITWTLDSDGLLTLSGSGALEDYAYEDSPFYQNTAIRAAAFESGITDVTGALFFGCTALRRITFSASVTHINGYVGESCARLETLIVSGSNPVYVSAGNCIIEKETGMLVLGCKSSVIPADGSVKRIGQAAFWGCTGLTQIEIPDSVTSIGTRAFSGCEGLKSITLPDSITSVESRAFSGCKALTDVRLPEGLKEISASLFFACTSLKEITLPESVTAIGWYAFTGCEKLERIDLPELLTSIGNNAFESCASLKNITLPEGVTELGMSVFYGCAALQSITIPASVKSIRNNVGIPDQTVIYGYAGSYAQQWAAEKGRTFVALEGPADAGIRGDVNGDGRVTAADARLALRKAVGLEQYADGSAQFLACDADGNGKVTAADARKILRAAVGLETLA